MPSYVELRAPRGAYPKADPHALPLGFAQTAVNTDLRGGVWRPRRRSRQVAQLTGGGCGLVVADGRFLGTGEPARQIGWRNRTVVSDTNGGQIFYIRNDDDPFVIYPLGMPVGSMTVTATPSGGLSGDDLTVSYAFALRNRDGDESDLWGLTTVTGRSDDIITVGWTVRSDHPADFDPTDARLHIYATQRSVGGDGRFYHIGDQPAPTAGASGTFTDLQTTPRNEVKAVYSGATLPPTGLKSVLLMPGDFIVAHDGEFVWMSEVGQPATMPPDYRYRPPGGEIIGIERKVDNLYIFTKGAPPTILQLILPGEGQPFFTDSRYPCVSGESIVSVESGVIYASRAGMVEIRGSQGSRLLTQNQWDERTFQQLSPETLRCDQFDNTVIAYNAATTFLLDPQAASGTELVFCDERITDTKEQEGRLNFITDADYIFEWEATDFFLPMEWKSGNIRYPRPGTLGAVQVKADFTPQRHTQAIGGIGADGIAAVAVGDTVTTVTETTFLPTVTLTIESDDGDRLAEVVAFDDEPFVVQGGLQEDDYVVTVRAETVVNAIYLAASQSDLRNV